MDNPLVKMAAPTMVLLSTHLTKLSPTDKKGTAMGLDRIFIWNWFFSPCQQAAQALCFPTNFFVLPLKVPNGSEVF